VGVTYAPPDATTLRIEYAAPLNLGGSGPAASRLWFHLESRI